MKIVIATLERDGDRRFGIGRALERLLAALEGQEVIYLTPEDGGRRSRKLLALLRRWGERRWSRSGSNLLLLLTALLERINMGRLAAKVARRERVDVAYLQDPFLIGGFLLFAGRKRPRVGITYHAFGSYATNGTYFAELIQRGWQLRFLRSLERWIVQRCDFVVTTTQTARNRLARDLAIWPIPSSWRVIPHPIPDLPPLSRPEARRRLHLPLEGKMVLAVGRGRVKRFGLLVRSFAQIGDPAAFLVIVGPGEDPELRRTAQELGISERLFLRIADDMAPYYRAADLYVSCSQVEAFGLANLEALAAGLPVVATAVGGVPEVLGPAALLLPEDCSEQLLAQTVSRLLRDPFWRQQLRTLARAWLHGWPGPEGVARAYLELFQGRGRDLLPPRNALPPPPLSFRGSLPDWIEPLAVAAWSGILCFAPHPDDETLGMGGTLARSVALGKRVSVVLVTDGRAGDPHRFSRDVVAERLQAWRRALGVLGVDRTRFLGERDGQLTAEDLPRLRRLVAEEIEAAAPDAIFIPPLHDFHRDHLFTALAVLEAWRDLGFPGECYFYEVGQPHLPTHFLDISEQLERKRQALAQYRLERRYLDLPALSEALTTFRTRTVAASCRAIETFMRVDPGALDPLIASMLTLRKLQEGAPLEKGLDQKPKRQV